MRADIHGGLRLQVPALKNKNAGSQPGDQGAGEGLRFYSFDTNPSQLHPTPGLDLLQQFLGLLQSRTMELQNSGEAMHISYRLYLTCLTMAVGLSQLSGATVYSEAISGDLSDSGLTPTSISLAVGSNQIFGTTGRGTSALDRDYFSINLPAGLNLTGITVLPGTQSGGPVSFIGLQAGNQVTVATNAPDATGLLGWWHYGPADINTNILPEMAVPSTGSSGFSLPLGSGNYSFWIQDFNAGSFAYGLDLLVTQTPEPASSGMVLAGVATLIAFLRKRGASTLRRVPSERTS